MKKLSESRLIIIKKIIGFCSALICMSLMFVGVIRYTSSSMIGSSKDSVQFSDSVSLYSFLFNGNYEVLDSKVSILRDTFKFSYMILWMCFIFCLVGIALLAISFFVKKSLISKIGGYIFLGGILALSLLVFDRYERGNTVKYLDVFTWWYGLIILVSIVGLMSSSSLTDGDSNK